MLLGTSLAFGIAACSGGSTGGTPVVHASGSPSTTPDGPEASVAFTVKWPAAAAASSARNRKFVSPSTASVTVSVNGGAVQTIGNPNLALTPTSSQYTDSTTVSITAPPSAPGSTDSFLVSSYDTSSKLLGQSLTNLAVVMDAANILTVTLDGNLAKIGVSVLASPFVSGTGLAFTHVGVAPQQYTITPEDADGNMIVSPGNLPKLTLTSATPASVSETPTSTSNVYSVQSKVEGVTVTLTAAGTSLAGTAVTQPFTVTTVAGLYIANHGIGSAAESVAIYPVTATAAATPIAILTGSATEENAIQYPAVDANGNLYLSNQGPMPGAIYGPTSGYVSIFKPASQNGNHAPDDVIANLPKPEGLAFDSSGDLYSMQIRSLVEYGPGAGGSSIPIATIGAPNPTASAPAPVNNTDIDGCYGVSVDAGGTIYAACTYYLATFAKGTTGNTAPATTISPLTSSNNPLMPTYGDDDWLSVAADSTGEIYAPAFNNNLDEVFAYAAGASDGARLNATPAFMATGTAFDVPFGIATDTADQIYVSNYAGSSVAIFSSQTVLATGLATTTLTNGINGPYGIVVR